MMKYQESIGLMLNSLSFIMNEQQVLKFSLKVYEVKLWYSDS